MLRSFLLIGLVGLFATSGAAEPGLTFHAPESDLPSAGSETAVSAAAGFVSVNLYAEVRSDDGYLNVRAMPGSQGVLSEIPSGERVLVLYCQPGVIGSRWCYVERVGQPRWSLDIPEAAGLSGFVHDAELRYEDVPVIGLGQVYPSSAAGRGMPLGFTMTRLYGQIEGLVRGRMPIRTAPTSEAPALAEYPNFARVSTIACGPGAGGTRWCLAWVDTEDSSGGELQADRIDEVLGYIDMGAVTILEEDAVATGPMEILELDRTPVNRMATVLADDGYVNLRAAPGTDGRRITEFFNGFPMLVTSCEPGARGSRWCHVEMVTYETEWFPESNPGWLSGFVHDSGLSYEDPPSADVALGHGVARGFEAAAGAGRVRSDDGYVNLRTGPASASDVITRVPNGARISPLACAPGSADARWCLVWAYEDDYPPDYEGMVIASAEQSLGYVYTAEVVDE